MDGSWMSAPSGGAAAFRRDGREGRRPGADAKKKKKPSLFDAYLAAAAAGEPAAASTAAGAAPAPHFYSGVLPPPDDDDAGGGGARRRPLTYVGFSIVKIRQELFQSWLSGQPDVAQYRCADLVAAGAVEAVFQELVRVACLCAPACPRLLAEVAAERVRITAHFAERQQAEMTARAVSWMHHHRSSGNGGGKAAQHANKRGGGGGSDETAFTDWIGVRNEAALRRPLARLVLLAYLALDEAAAAYVPPPFVPQDEYVRARLEQHLQADSPDKYARMVLRNTDPPSVRVAANELLFQLSGAAPPRASPAGLRRLNAVSYWLQWLAYRALRGAGGGGGVECAERAQFCPAPKLATHPVWLGWDALYCAAAARRSFAAGGGGDAPSLLSSLDLLSAEFQRGYRGNAAAIKQRMHLMYCAAGLVLFGADWAAPLVRGPPEVLGEVERRIDFDADIAYRVLQKERARVAAAAAPPPEEDGDEEGGRDLFMF